MIELKEPQKKVSKVDHVEISLSNAPAGSSQLSSTSNIVQTDAKKHSDIPSTSSKSIERLPCGAKPVFKDFKFDNLEMFAQIFLTSYRL